MVLRDLDGAYVAHGGELRAMKLEVKTPERCNTPESTV